MNSSNIAISSETAICVNGLSKCYQIYDVPRDRLKQFVAPRLQRLAGQEVKQYFREFWALRDVAFEVKKGETVGIIGRNGSGKSTLLQIICGTLSPTGGNIETRGRIAALLELGSGFNPEFTGRENIYMNASVLGLSSAEIDACFDDIVAFADIGEFIEQPVKTYSSGMYVRLAFAVIAHVKADILIIDEALSVGDAFFVQKCMRFLRKFMERGTVLFVSHDIGAVLNLCQAVVWLHKGAVEAIGAPKEITELYLEKLYEDQQGTNVGHRSKAMSSVDLISGPVHDMRLDFINQTKFRNDIELFSFPQDAPSFGKGGVTITSVRLMDQAERSLTWVVGGEQVSLIIECQANTDISSPIVGFFLRDRLGQTLIGDNTYLSYALNPLNVKKGEHFRAAFTFLMPILPVGKYSFSAAIAEGTQHHHVQHHWIHDALMVQSVSSSAVSGLIGIPMHLIEMEINN
jgi:lipopolysaccharide transport system ATP-binding protein